MRKEILEILDKNDFVSGQKLAKKFDVSRTAVWKQIENLRKIGYEIESVKNKGYRLVSKPDRFIPEEISQGLNTNIIGKKILHFNSIDSTNLYAKKVIKKKIDEGLVIISDFQEKGKGRKNRYWHSGEGGLWFSVVLCPNISPDKAMLITMAFSISIAKVVQNFTNLKPIIKWPNDLLLNNKKFCGILTELDAEMDKINYAIVGVGINVNNLLSGDITDTATTLSNETNEKLSKVKILKKILGEIDKNYIFLKSGEYDFIRDFWFSFSNILGKKIKIIQDKNTFSGEVVDIDKTGALIVKTRFGKERILSGDIKFK